MKNLEQLEQEAKESRNDLSDAIILASVSMMTYQLALARKDALDKIKNEMMENEDNQGEVK